MFALLPERPVKIFGVSLATAAFLDAFVVHSLLLPAVSSSGPSPAS